MTIGEMMFYGGITGTIVCTLILVVSWGIFEKKKKNLRKRIEDEY